MGVRPLQQLHMRVVRHLPGHQHAARVVLPGQLALEMLAPGGVGEPRAVADLVAAQHHHLHVGPRLQQVGQHAHHHVEAAIRLQVARDVGDQPVLRSDGEAVHRQRPRPRLRIRGADVQVHPLLQQVDLRLRPVRIERLLPLGRRLPVLVQRQRQEVDRVHGADARILVGGQREFRVEADILAGHPVVELEIAEQRHVRPDIDQVQQLAPAVMADDHVRAEAQALQVARHPGDVLGPHHRQVQVADMRMGRLLRRHRHLVVEAAHAGDVVLVRLRDEGDLGALAPQQVADRVQELPGEVLVDEQVFHAPGEPLLTSASPPPWARPACGRASRAPRPWRGPR